MRFWGLRSGFALRRYVPGLAGLLGPAAAFGGFGLAFGHPCTSLGQIGVLRFGHTLIKILG